MERITKYLEESPHAVVGKDKISLIPEGYTGEAVELLARFENFRAALEQERERTETGMERLKKEGKTKSYQFRELMGKRGMCNYVIGMMKIYDLE